MLLPNEPNPDFEHRPPDPESVTPGLAPGVSPLDAAADTVNVDINKPSDDRSNDDTAAADQKLRHAATCLNGKSNPAFSKSPARMGMYAMASIAAAMPDLG
jgi:hypothetical protein